MKNTTITEKDTEEKIPFVKAYFVNSVAILIGYALSAMLGLESMPRMSMLSDAHQICL